MALRKIKFCELIELTNIKNSDNKYGIDDAIGVNMEKIIKPMRGNNEEKDFEKFHLVPPRHFAYNPRGGSKLGLGFNDTERTYIITFNDNVFKIKESAKNILLEEYLYMYLCRKEWDRFAEFISWGSSTVVFDWKDFCDVEIELPDLRTQQKYVDVYLSMIENQKAYERGLDDLKLVCDFIIESQRLTERKRIKGHLIPTSEKNIDSMYIVEKGVSIQKSFIDTKASSSDIRTQKVIKVGEFAFNSNTSRNSDTISIALNEDEPFIVSNTYGSFKCDELIIPQYLYLWFKRKEFDRFARFNSWGSAREIINIEDIEEYVIAIPSINEQMSTVNLLKAYQTRRQLNERLKQQIKEICPILIKGSIEEAKEA